MRDKKTRFSLEEHQDSGLCAECLVGLLTKPQDQPAEQALFSPQGGKLRLMWINLAETIGQVSARGGTCAAGVCSGVPALSRAGVCLPLPQPCRQAHSSSRAPVHSSAGVRYLSSCHPHIQLTTTPACSAALHVPVWLSVFLLLFPRPLSCRPYFLPSLPAPANPLPTRQPIAAG